MEAEERIDEEKQQARHLPPLMFSVSICRETGRVATTNSIGITDDPIHDVAMLLEAFAELSRELQARLVDMRVVQRLEEMDLKAAPHLEEAVEKRG
jgi:hypothetical protein